MSDKCFGDTNIWVYAHDRSAGLKHKRARQLVEDLWESGRGVLSTGRKWLRRNCERDGRSSPPMPTPAAKARIPVDITPILKALAFAADKHRDQRRKDAEAWPRDSILPSTSRRVPPAM